MNYRLKYLKIKIKSLAAEQVLIRQERQRASRSRAYAALYKPAEASQWQQLVDGLQTHRLHAVRPEIRAALMAYGLLRGKRPEQIEPKARTPIDEKRVNELLRKYGPPGQVKMAA